MMASKENNLTSILEMLITIWPDVNFDTFRNASDKTSIYSKIAKNLSNKKIRFASDIRRYIDRNLTFVKAFLENRTEYYRCIRDTSKNKSVYSALAMMSDFNESDLFLSYRQSNSKFGDMCKILGKANNLKNRKLMKYNAEQYFKMNKEFLQRQFYSSTPKSSPVFENKHSSNELITDSPIVDEVYYIPKESDLNAEKIRSLQDNLKQSMIETTTNSTDMFVGVTPEKIKYPRQLLELPDGIENPNKVILPKNAVNDLFLEHKNNKQCTFFEGEFEIPSNVWSTICSKGRLNTFYFPFYIKRCITHIANNTCEIIFKYTKYLKNGTIRIRALCKHNNYQCKKFSIIITHNRYVKVFSSSLNYCHKNMLTSYVKGVGRLIEKQNILFKKPSELKRDRMIEANTTLIHDAKNLQAIKSDCTFRKLKSDAIASFDRDKNDFMDIVKTHLSHPEYIKEVSMPFSVKVFSDEQIFILESQRIDDVLPVVYFDATGSVARKPFESEKRVLLYSAVVSVSQLKSISPIFEMVTSHHNTHSICKLLTEFRTFCEQKRKWPIFGSIVTDFSFASLHAISKACNNLKLGEYLNYAFKICDDLRADIPIPATFITIHLCCAHFMKMVSNDVAKHFLNPEEQQVIKFFIAGSILMDNLQKISMWFINMTILLKSPYQHSDVDKSFNILSSLLSQKSPTVDMNEIIDLSNKCNNSLKQVGEPDTLYKGSPFYKHFRNLAQKPSMILSGTIPNKFYSKNFHQLLVTKYMPYVPLWSAILIRKCYNTTRFSNSYVENYFGNLKNNLLDGQRNLKLSRFLRKSRKNVLAIYTALCLEIPKTALTRQKRHVDAADENTAEESWNKKKKKTNTYFSGNYQKITATLEKNSTAVLVELDSSDKCNYCGSGRLDNTAWWVQCDICNGWVHQDCEDPTRDYEKSFICKCCQSESQVEINVSTSKKRLDELCRSYLNKLQLSLEEQESIELLTREQRMSNLWRQERHKRLTTANFGDVMRATTDQTKINIAKNKYESKDISHIPSVKYGIENERRAIDLYVKKTGNKWEKCGLIVDKDLPFLAGSPDGFVNNDGLIEVKCLYSLRNCQIVCSKVDCLDAHGNLKKTHSYYFQIQGLLAISNRNWCDLVLFTNADLKIIKVARNIDTWENMKTRLQDFYYFYYLPLLVLPKNVNITPDERKWTIIKTLNFYQNGLINDTSYYKVHSNRDYTVAKFDNSNFILKEVLSSDFDTLSKKNWLCGSVVSILLHIYNTNADYQIIEETLSTSLFSESITSSEMEHIARRVQITNKKIVMPTIVNGNHFILILADFERNCFTLLDPMTIYEASFNKYLKQFKLFATVYNKINPMHIVDCTNLIRKSYLHIKQRDGYNCGPLIVYFFKQLVSNNSLQHEYNMSTFRCDLKTLILEKSSDMSKSCLICGREVAELRIQCKYCLRYVHDRCNRDFVINEFCCLCKMY